MRVPIPLFLIALLLAGGASGCDKVSKKPAETSSPAAATEKAATPVRVAMSKHGLLKENAEMTGHLQAGSKAAVHSRIAGKVLKVNYKVGDKVSAGDTLITLDQSALRAAERQAEANVLAAQARLRQAKESLGLTDTQLDLEVGRAQQAVYQAQAQVSLTKANLDDAIHNQKRQQSLYDQSAVSKYSVEQNDLRAKTSRDQWEAAKSAEKAAQEALKIAQANRRKVQISESDVQAAAAAVEQAQAALQSVRTDLRDTVIKAPISGTIIARNVEPGQAFGGGSAQLMMIADNSKLELYAPLEEAYSIYVKPGTQLNVTTSLNVSAVAKVKEIVPSSDTTTHMAKVRMIVPNPSGKLFDGNYATVTIDLKDHVGTLIPRSCVCNNEGNIFVVIDQNNVAKRVPVSVVFQNDTEAIVDGLDEGVMVVTSGGTNIFDDQKLEIIAEGTDKQ
ncbi:efflux RND transporter periplasmic adaptor subunit [bacterium]|nr:efflux RND transporter periplasmic adaptor subunit [bacterium]